MSTLLNSYQRITAPSSASRTLQRTGFRMGTIVRSGTILTFGPSFYRSNDDRCDIVQTTTLTCDLSVSGVGGIHEFNGTRKSKTEYAYRILKNESSGLIAYDCFESRETEPPIPDGFNASRIVYKVMTTNSSNLFSMTINAIGNQVYTRYSVQDNAVTILQDGSDGGAKELDASVAIPHGSGTIGLMQVEFKTGLLGSANDALSVHHGSIGNLMSQVVLRPGDISDNLTRVSQEIAVDEQSKFFYQVTNGDENRAGFYAHGYIRTIGGDD